MLGGAGRREAQPGQWLRRTFRIWGLGKKRDQPLLRLPHSSAHLKEDDEGQPDGQNEPELLRQVVVPVVPVVPVPEVGKSLESGIRSLEGILWEIRGSKPAHGHIFLASHLAMVLEVLGVEDGQAVVDIALEAAGEREKCGTLVA